GKIRVFRQGTGQLADTPFVQVAGLSQGNEQGLLGLAFAPDYAQSGLFYVNFTDAGGTTHVRRFRVSAANPDVADPATATTVLTVPQPFANHNGGWLGFGPRDGLLYVALGDGGSEGDPRRLGQDRGQLLGKMLRIDVNRNDFPGDPTRHYAIPPSNPFLPQAGVRPEIWAYGLRNPWRNSFDRLTGDLWIGDVGQDEREEVNFQPAASTGGENYGWRLREGTRNTGLDPIPPQARLTDPVVEYTHDEGSGVVGGYVYRGSAVPGLAGTYFLADISGPVWTLRFD